MSKIKEFFNNKIVKVIIFIFASLITIYSLNKSINFLISLIIDEFDSFFPLFGMFLIYLLPLIYYFIILKEKFISKNKDMTYYIFIGISNLILLIGIIFCLTSESLAYFEVMLKGKYINFIFPIDLILITLALIVIVYYYVIKLLLKGRINELKYENNEEIKEEKDDLRKNFKIYEQVYLYFITFFSFYFFSLALSYLFISYDNFNRDNIGYLIILLSLITPLISLTLYLFNHYFKKKYLLFISLIINLISIISYISYEFISPNFVVKVGKNLFLADFALNFPILQYLLLLSNLTSIILIIIKIIKSYKKIN